MQIRFQSSSDTSDEKCDYGISLTDKALADLLTGGKELLARLDKTCNKRERL
ncbi:unnamed protein product [Larinioides sclopetarius]|uniref:Uncharacterized protein n=1 Tax=Larinioides sclopetarius TaxID=280406 RepID=A0AAV1ZWN7_9ARAC